MENKLFLERNQTNIREGPNTTTTVFELISRSPIFQFCVCGAPGCRIKCPFWTVEHRENAMISHSACAIKCRFDATSDAKVLGKIMVVAAFGSCPKHLGK